MISVQNMSFGYGAKSVYEGVTFSVPLGYKVGLVGPNGAGKSTLLKILRKEEPVESGKVEVLGSIGFVPQEIKHDPILDKSESIKDYIDPGFLHQEFELKNMLDGLELGHLNLGVSPKGLSGGQKTKLALARALLATPDILMLDEPTNFMDVAGKRWVMDFLSTYPYTLIVISHDLNLLDQSIDKILEVDPAYNTINEYRGNYSKYLLLKVAKAELFEKNLKKQQKKVAQLEDSLRSMSGKTSAKGVRQRVMMQRRVERAKTALPELPQQAKMMKKIVFPDPFRVGATPLKLLDLSKSYGEKKDL